MFRMALFIALIALTPRAGAAVALPPGYFMSLGLYRPSTHTAIAYADLNTQALAWNSTFGISGDVPVAADFNGDGVYDLAVYRNGTWYIDTNHDFVADTTVPFGGVAGDIPLAADFDGDGSADLVIYRAGTWFIRSSANGTVSSRTLGGAGGQPVIADFDGDGIPDIAVYLGGGAWQIKTSGGAFLTPSFGGQPQDLACAVDWNHDGAADLCIFRDGTWYIQSVDGSFSVTYAFGAPGDIPLAGGVFEASGIYVRAGAAGTQNGTAAHPYATITQAINAASSGAVIRVAPGNYSEAVTLNGSALGAGGKDNLKLLGVGQRSAHWTSASGSTFTLQASTGNILEGFTIGANGTPPNQGRGIVLAGGGAVYLTAYPGATLNLAFNTITNTQSYGVLVTGKSHADIRHNHITYSQTKSGIGTQDATPSATIAYNEVAHNGYMVAVGSDGNGIETQSSSTVSIIGNQIHDNNRYGIIGVVDSNLTITNNSITANQWSGIIVGGAGANDTTTTQLSGNSISANGLDTSTYLFDGMEINNTSVATHTLTGNTFFANPLDGLYVGSGTLIATGNTFQQNQIGITLGVDGTSSTNVQATLTGNAFVDNSQDGLFLQRSVSGFQITANVGGTQFGQANVFSGQGFHGIGCYLLAPALTCPVDGNTFYGNANNSNVEGTCPASCWGDTIFANNFDP